MSPNEDIALTRFLDSVQLRQGKNQTRFKDYHQLLREANVAIEIEIVVYAWRELVQASWPMHARDNDPARITTLRVSHQLTKLNANMLDT